MADLTINAVVTASKSWPNFDISSGSRVTDMLVLPDESVILLECEKSRLIKFVLSSSGKYEKSLKSVNGFTTKPQSVCSYPCGEKSQVRLAVLERSKDLGSILFTCSDSFGEKEYLGCLKETSFSLQYNWFNPLFYVGMYSGNVVVIDMNKCQNKSQSHEISFVQTITVDQLVHRGQAFSEFL